MIEQIQSQHMDTGAEMTYLAVPYTDTDPLVREIRYKWSNKAQAHLSRLGLLVVNPIGMGHMTSVEHGMPVEFAYWEQLDKRLINACDSVTVLTLPGWENSVGVQSEIEHALINGKHVSYLHPEDID